MILETLPEVIRLSPREKLQLASELWDELETLPNEDLLTPEQMAELNRRLDVYERNPEQGSTWEEVKARILAKQPKAE